MRESREQQIRANLQRLVRAHAAAMAVLEESIAILQARLAEYFPEDPPPRATHHTNRGLIELGAYAARKLRQRRTYLLHPWNPVEKTGLTASAEMSSRRDGLKLARYYQSLLDSGKFESRSALARFLGVSRARVTQVLKRLERQQNSNASTRSDSDTEVA